MATEVVHPPQSRVEQSEEFRRKWDEKYRSGPKPWDTRITPPEVQAFWQSGRIVLPDLASSTATETVALDIGCGPGTNTAYLACLGIRTTGIEISSLALATARQRHAPALAAHRLSFIQADVTRLPLADARAHYVLDIGCLHGLPANRRLHYAQGIIANLRPGGYYHLFAFDRREEEQADDNVSGVAPGELDALFLSHFQLVEAIQANPDMRPCKWYLFQLPG